MPFTPWSGSSSGGGQQVYQFAPETYGAAGNGKIINDATVAGGALSTLTSASAVFTSADQGKTFMLNGGQGNNAQPLIGTITAVGGPTSVTMSVPATGAVTNGSCVYGNDDTAAFNSAMSAISTYAQAAGGNFHAQLILANKLYCLATPPPITAGIVGSTTSQIPIPFPAASGVTQKLLIDIIGVGANDACMYFNSTVPDVRGTALVSMVIPPFIAGTNPEPSVIGLQYANTGGLTSGFANTEVYVDGVSVIIPFLGPQGAYDFRFLSAAGGGKFGAFAFGAPISGAYNNLQSLPSLAGQTGGNSFGIYMPRIGNNAAATIQSFVSEGFTYGAVVTEHSAFHRLTCIYPVAGISVRGGGAHGAYIGYACVENGFSALQCTDPSAFPLNVAILDTEGMTTWHVQDTNNALRGTVLVHTNNASPPLVSGATGYKIRWDGVGVGHWASPPAVPASGTPQQNTAWLDASVTVHTGAGVTVTAIAVDGTTTGLTMAASSSLTLPTVPPGKNVTLTYAGGTPTWDWWLT